MDSQKITCITVLYRLVLILQHWISSHAAIEQCPESEVLSPDNTCVQFMPADVAFFNTTYEFDIDGLERAGCSGWTFINNAGFRTDIELLKNDKYSITENGYLILQQVEPGDEGRYYCRGAIDGAIHYEIRLDVHKEPKLRINVTSQKDSTAVLDVMFNIYPGIKNLNCNSQWVTTTNVTNEDGTSDVRGELTLNVTSKKLKVECVTELVCGHPLTFDTVMVDLTNQSEEIRNKSGVGTKVTAINNCTADHLAKGVIYYRSYFLGFGIPLILLILLCLILLVYIALRISGRRSNENGTISLHHSTHQSHPLLPT